MPLLTSVYICRSPQRTGRQAQLHPSERLGHLRRRHAIPGLASTNSCKTLRSFGCTDARHLNVWQADEFDLLAAEIFEGDEEAAAIARLPY